MRTFHIPTFLSEADLFIIREQTSGHRDPVSDRMNAILVRTYGRPAVEAILAKRREAVARHVQLSRHWQTRATRRAARNRHSDAYGTRERYVRGIADSLWTPPNNRENVLLWHAAHPEAFRPSWIVEALNV